MVFAVLAIRKNKSVILLPLFAFMVCTASVCGIYSIQFFGVYFITLIAAIAHIGLSGISRKNCGLIFLLTGIFTSFIDLLTFPLLTLVVPFLVWLSVAERGSSNRSLVVDAALYIFLWGLGYFGMWCGKWVLATIVTNVDVIALATNSIIFRTLRGDSTSGSVLQAILLNYSYYKQSFFVIILPCLIFSVFVGIKGFRRNMFDKSKVIVPIVICCFVAIFPIIWIAILTNHSYIHSWFVYRICFISPLAIMSACLMPYLVHSRKNTAKENTSHM